MSVATDSASHPANWNEADPSDPSVMVSSDTLTGKWRVKVNFGMGYPWITCNMESPFRVADSGPVFESESAASDAGDFVVAALEVLMHDFSTKGN